ncbi:hypothetical protein NOV18_08695 [Pseudomonas asiatica]|uniref:Uncharacterized protein n=1 Tax=Pseudomonas asiatica TaxID=2219225 RepID=A0AAJ5HZS5_9PSED|nr:hypothetical protein [Pseudomonas asiatica]UUC20542.1 hypothetical protein NOV18_08695 [Pseudomonas asiatica]
MKKETITLSKDEDYVIVDPGSRAHDHFVSLGYQERGVAIEKAKPKRRSKESAATAASAL